MLATTSTTGAGFQDLISAVGDHLEYLRTSGEWIRRERGRLQTELEALLQDALRKRWEEKIEPASYQKTLNQVIQREITPWRAVKLLLEGAGI